jgi:hypothetical protein
LGIKRSCNSGSSVFSENFDVFAFCKPPYAIEIVTAVKGKDLNDIENLPTE